MRSSLEIKLTPQERHELRLIVRRHKAPHREVVRAQIILQLAKGVTFSETSRTVGVARRIVHKWAKRFFDKRMEGLKDRPRIGRPARFSPDRGNVSDQAGLRTAG